MGERCANHSRREATFRCDSCGRTLCGDCVEVGKHLMFCSACGELALPVDAEPAPVLDDTPDSGYEPEVEDPDPEWPQSAETVYKESEFESEPEEPPVVAALQGLMQHVIVPAAIIGMLASLLFYLLDVRSVFYTGGADLKARGFWFVVASVLIARYGKMYRSSAAEERQGMYTVLLFLATTLTILMAPWARGGQRSLLGTLVVAGLAIAIWRFAGRLVDALDLDRPRPYRRKMKLYGLARLRYEAWLISRGQTPPGRIDIASQYSRSSRSIAKFGLLAILLFALGEPFLLAGPSYLGLWALLAMAAFFLTGGVLLASGSAGGTYQLVRALGGRAALSVIPSRIFVAVLLMIGILALAASFPGITYRGLGELQPEGPAEEGTFSEDGAEGEASSGEDEVDAEEGSGSGGEETGGDTADYSSDSAETSPDPGSDVLGAVAGTALVLGRWLWILIGLAMAIAVLVVLLRFGAGGLRRVTGRFWDWLGALVSRVRPRQRAVDPGPPEDPFADSEAIAYVAPPEAIIESYRRLQVFFAQSGYERSSRQTPHEYLAELPARWRSVGEPVAELTELYVRAVYSDASVGEDERRRALASLFALKRS